MEKLEFILAHMVKLSHPSRNNACKIAITIAWKTIEHFCGKGCNLHTHIQVHI